ncbi:MAG: serine hydrolase domain-containing protein [Actinomycetota bacterium]
MLTTSRRIPVTRLTLIIGIFVSSLCLPAMSRAATGDIQTVSPLDTITVTPNQAGREAQRTAYELLGDRPFQAVLMSGGRAVMTASSLGTSPFSDVPIASISKLVTSMALMRLVERGVVSMNETMGNLFSPVILPERWRVVTVTQLLSHMSGFAADRDRWFNDTYSSCFDAFRRIVQRDAPSGAGYEYSNTNFCALSLAIGSLSGPSYDDAVFRLVLRPLGIARKKMDPEYANLSGAGGWRMSALDVGRIVSAVDPNAPLSPLSSAIRTQMIQRTSYNYGLGVWIWDPDTYGHSGSLYRARSIAVRLPSGRVAVILTQATFPESGLDLLPIAQRIDAAFGSSCAESPCEFRGLDPFNAVPTGIRGRAQI